MVRIVAGILGGRKLAIAIPPGVRPTTERLREALFSILASRVGLETLTWLDLFGGSGAIGFEAISRGAPQVIYNDHDAVMMRQVRKVAMELGVADRLTCYATDADACCRRLRNQEFGIIFLDPPYRYEGFEVLGEGLPTARYVVVESSHEVSLGSRWQATWWRRYGETRLGLFEPARGEETEAGSDGIAET